jgi:HPt (histidine-containing phosphotransfer) domain-containing protein
MAASFANSSRDSDSVGIDECHQPSFSQPTTYAVDSFCSRAFAQPVAADILKQFTSLFGGAKNKAGVVTYRAFSQRFLETIDSRVAQLIESLQQEDACNSQRLAHQLRSSFGTFGATELTEFCERIESEIQLKHSLVVTNFNEFRGRLLEQTAVLKQEVQSFLKSLPNY